MKAIELKKRYLKEDKLEIFGVIAIGKGYWYHVHNDEVIPEDCVLALHPREAKIPQT